MVRGVVLEKKIKDAISRYGMEEIFDGCVVGFSGGADSSAILHYLKDKCKNLVAVHINHMIRGEEADRDEMTCKRACQEYGVSFMSFHVDVPSLSKERKKGLEEVARDERYRIFKDVLKSDSRYKCIVTAHNANDNCETILFNLSRGGGTKGLSGISPVNEKVFRPLIFCTREEIINYCNDNNIEYVTDSTNSDTDYTRNYIRHKVLPLFTQLNGNFVESCSRVSHILRQDEEYIGGVADKILNEHIPNGRLDKEIALGLDKAILSRVLKKMCLENLDYTSINSILSLIDNWHSGKMINLTNKITFKLEHSYCHFIKNEEMEHLDYETILSNGINYVGDMVVCLNCALDSDEYKEKGRACLNSENIQGQLFARNKQDGDCVRSLGVTKKLKKVFTDKHIPSHERNKIPVICDSKGVVAIPGIIVRDGAFDKKGDITIIVYEKI